MKISRILYGKIIVTNEYWMLPTTRLSITSCFLAFYILIWVSSLTVLNTRSTFYWTATPIRPFGPISWNGWKFQIISNSAFNRNLPCVVVVVELVVVDAVVVVLVLNVVDVELLVEVVRVKVVMVDEVEVDDGKTLSSVKGCSIPIVVSWCISIPAVVGIYVRLVVSWTSEVRTTKWSK